MHGARHRRREETLARVTVTKARHTTVLTIDHRCSKRYHISSGRARRLEMIQHWGVDGLDADANVS